MSIVGLAAFARYESTKVEALFCYPEYIAVEMSRLFDRLKATKFLSDLPTDDFVAELTSFLAKLNAIHPFREGNGRAQTAFVTLLADRAGHPFDFDRLDPQAFLAAVIDSFHGNEEQLAMQLRGLIGSAP